MKKTFLKLFPHSSFSSFLGGRSRGGNHCCPSCHPTGVVCSEFFESVPPSGTFRLSYISKVFLAFSFLLAPFFVSAASLIDGLVGYWTFNGADISGVTVYDKSGQGNNGTLTNSPTKVAGKLGQGLYFDGVNDYININNPVLGDTYTISAWVKVSDFTTNRPLYGEYEATTNDTRNFIQVATTGKAVFDQYRPSSGSAASPFSLVAGKWYLLTGVQTASNSRTIYIDGVAVVTSSEVYSGNTPTIFNIGRRYNILQGDTFFKGIMDDVRLYNRALSASEISSLYKLGTATVNASQNTKSTNGLVGHWSFDGKEIVGTTAYDSSGLGNNGTLTNGSKKVAGKLGQGLSFDGTNYVNVGDPANGSLDFTSSFSMSFWMKCSYVSSKIQAIAGKSYVQSLSTGGGYGFTLDSGTNLLGFQVRDSVGGLVGSNSINAINDGKWHHVVGVRNHPGNTSYLYVDGVLNDTDVGSVATYASAIPFGLGARYRITTLDWIDTAAVEAYRGLLDDVRVYGRTLSASEIQTLYKLGTATVNASQNTKSTNGLVGHWSFDGKEIVGTTAYDSSGQGNNGTLTNGPTKVVGKLGQALSFDGVTQYGTLGNAVLSDAPATFTAWVYLKVSGEGRAISLVEKNSGGTGAQVKMGLLASSDYVTCNLQNGGNIVTGTSATVMSIKSWHFLSAVFTKSGSNYTCTAYLDGVPGTPVTGSGTPGVYNSTYIGANFRDNGVLVSMSNSIIDDVRIYNRVLSASELLVLYKLGIATVGVTQK